MIVLSCPRCPVVSVLDTVVMSGDDVWYSGWGVSVMWSELLMTSAISCPLWSSVYECQRVECAGALGWCYVWVRCASGFSVLSSSHTCINVFSSEHNSYPVHVFPVLVVGMSYRIIASSWSLPK